MPTASWRITIDILSHLIPSNTTFALAHTHTHIDTLGMERNPDLVGPIPSELGMAVTLQWVAFDHTGLTGTVPTELAQLTQLSVLSFEGTSVVGTIPNEICMMGIQVAADCITEVQCSCCFECCFDDIGCIPS